LYARKVYADWYAAPSKSWVVGGASADAEETSLPKLLESLHDAVQVEFGDVET